MSLESNIELVKEKMAVAAKKSQRSLEDILLIGVTKLKPTAVINEAIELGLLHFGENYLQEAQNKIREVSCSEVSWHFIGQLQTKKLKDIVGNFAWIHSVDKVKYAEEISRRAQQPQKILLQINISDEPSKGGLSLPNLPKVIDEVAQLDNIVLDGFMAMPPLQSDPELNRPFFAKMQELKENYGLRHLSMGTTSDYGVAIEEGATMVRVGTELFGAR